MTDIICALIAGVCFIVGCIHIHNGFVSIAESIVELSERGLK